ncbi:GHKL domain-containing protein [Brevibacillus fluminis]|uniref:GHKL domain-containing protein n=1 Tax=Brevibacillus fluminis TaxID=511487 RepID=A0A3M8CYS5_9BACL|nr:GHKL domain-containing protein [Brevibacillus fluminis]RNB80025.1 GHKL domain-containing protein [Brevibacillus fluminis]
MDILYNYLFIDLPEAVIALMAGMAVFNLFVYRSNVKKYVWVSLLYSAATTLMTALDSPYQLKVLLLFFWMSLLIYFFFQFPLGITVSITTCSFIFLISSEFFIILLFQIININLETLLDTPILLFSAVWLYLLLLLTMIFVMRKFSFDIRRLIPKTNLSRILVLLLLVGCVEFLLILTLNTAFVIQKYNPTFLYNAVYTNLEFYHALSLALFILLVILFWKYLSLALNRVEVETEKPYLQNIQDLVTAIRSIKHDAVNHYTALDGFLKVGMHDMASDYIQHLLREATDLVQVVEGVKSPAISSLLHSKMAICVANHITFTIRIHTSKQFDQMKSKDLTALLGNMLDNSIRASLEEPDSNRYILLEWGETETEYYLLIENSGPTIPPDKLEQIFNLNYTTKSNGIGGVGLAVVKNVVNQYDGAITSYSENGITRFRVVLSK